MADQLSFFLDGFFKLSQEDDEFLGASDQLSDSLSVFLKPSKDDEFLEDLMSFHLGGFCRLIDSKFSQEYDDFMSEGGGLNDRPGFPGSWHSEGSILVSKDWNVSDHSNILVTGRFLVF